MKRIALLLIIVGCLLFADDKVGITKIFPSCQNDSYAFEHVFMKDYGHLVHVGANEMTMFGIQTTPFYFESDKEVTIVYLQITNDTVSIIKTIRYKKS